jgi:hypothetical protein
MPRYANGSGGVDVHSVSTGDAVLTRSNLGVGAPARGDRFGAAVASDDVRNTDPGGLSGGGCLSIVIGAPGADRTGKVYVALSSDHGPGGDHDTVTLSDPHGRTGDEFGAAVLIARNRSVSDVWVGVPGKDVGAAVDAGAVEQFRVTSSGTASYLGMLTQNSPGVAGTAETGDRFGEVLSDGFTRLAVGVPHEDIGTAKDAGMVDVIALNGATGSVGITQNSPGMPGVAEAGDRFGAALVGSCNGNNLNVVGVPGEDVGQLRDAGAAESYSGCGSTFRAGKVLTENSPGIPGVAEAGDEFGAAITTSSGTDNGGTLYGVPGEDVGSVRDAGAVLMVPMGCPDRGPQLPCPEPARLDVQGHGAPGHPQAGARLGAALGTRFEGFIEDVTICDVLVGAPGEAVDGRPAAGAVYWHLAGDTGTTFTSTTTLSTGSQAHLGYGSVLGPDRSGD